jgi:hypothetical protein
VHRTFLATLIVLAECVTSARTASAQPGSPPPSVPPSFAGPPGATRDAVAMDPEPCRDRWFAIGECHNRRHKGPKLMLGLDLGISAMNESGPFGFRDGVGKVTNAGSAWGLHVGVELFPWLATEARYVGMLDSVSASVSPAGSVGFFTTGILGLLRFTAPLPLVHPYAFAGVGYYDVALVGLPSARAGSLLHSSAQAGIPMGVGLDVPLSWNVSIGVEATYHFQLSEDYSRVTTSGIDGGDLTTCNAIVRFRF